MYLNLKNKYVKAVFVSFLLFIVGGCAYPTRTSLLLDYQYPARAYSPYYDYDDYYYGGPSYYYPGFYGYYYSPYYYPRYYSSPFFPGPRGFGFPHGRIVR